MTRRLRLLLLAAPLLFFSACREDASPPFEAYVVAPDDLGVYAVRRAPLHVRDPHSLEGDSFTFLTADGVEVNGREPTDATVTGAQPLSLDLVVSDGAFQATDQDGLVALTTAHHLLVANAYVASLGLGVSPVKLRVVMLPEKVSTASIFGGVPAYDNAFYAPALRGFVILRENVFDELPFGMNLGVVAHEFGHSVFHRLTEAQPGIGLFFTPLDEGLADVLGAAVTGDPAFILPSAGLLGAGRDLQTYRRFVRADVRAGQSPYVYGSVVAHAFWRFRDRLLMRGLTPAEASRTMVSTAYTGVRDFVVPLPLVDRSKAELSYWRPALAAAGVHGDLFCEALREVFPPEEGADLPPTVCP